MQLLNPFKPDAKVTVTPVYVREGLVCIPLFSEDLFRQKFIQFFKFEIIILLKKLLNLFLVFFRFERAGTVNQSSSPLHMVGCFVKKLFL